LDLLHGGIVLPSHFVHEHDFLARKLHAQNHRMGTERAGIARKASIQDNFILFVNPYFTSHLRNTNFRSGNMGDKNMNLFMPLERPKMAGPKGEE
jgi:hypothetical protein